MEFNLSATLDSLEKDSDFQALTFDEKEQVFRHAQTSFLEGLETPTEVDVKMASGMIADRNQELRQIARAGRKGLDQNSYSKIFGELNNEFEFELDENGFISDSDANTVKIENAREGIRDIIYKHPELVPNANDLEFMTNAVLDQTDRRIEGKDNGWVKSAAYNFAQAGASRIATSLQMDDKGVREFFKENPKYDESFWIGKLPSGVGDVTSVMSMVAATSFVTKGPKLPAATSLYSNAAVRYQEAYDNEMAFSGDELKAREVAETNINAAAIDSIGDYLLTRALVPKGFKSLSTKGKLDYIKKNVDKAKVFKAVAGSFAAQGLSEVTGDAYSGFLQYNETGNPATIPSRKDLAESFFIGGIIGGGGAFGGQQFDNAAITGFEAATINKIAEGKAGQIKSGFQADGSNKARDILKRAEKQAAKLNNKSEAGAGQSTPPDEADPELASDTQQTEFEKAQAEATVDSLSPERQKLEEIKANPAKYGLTPEGVNKFQAELDRREAAEATGQLDTADSATIDEFDARTKELETELNKEFGTEQSQLLLPLAANEADLQLTSQEKAIRHLTENNRRAAKKVAKRLREERAAELEQEFIEKLAAEEGIVVDRKGNQTGTLSQLTSSEQAFKDEAARQRKEVAADEVAATIEKMEADQLDAEQQALAEELGFKPSILTGSEAEIKRQTEEGTAQLSDQEVATLIATKNSQRAAKKVLANIEADKAAEISQQKEEEFKAKLLKEEGINADEALAVLYGSGYQPDLPASQPDSLASDEIAEQADQAEAELEAEQLAQLEADLKAELEPLAQDIAEALPNNETTIEQFEEAMVAKRGEGIRALAREFFAKIKAYLGAKLEQLLARIDASKDIDLRETYNRAEAQAKQMGATTINVDSSEPSSVTIEPSGKIHFNLNQAEIQAKANGNPDAIEATVKEELIHLAEAKSALKDWNPKETDAVTFMNDRAKADLQQFKQEVAELKPKTQKVVYDGIRASIRAYFNAEAPSVNDNQLIDAIVNEGLHGIKLIESAEFFSELLRQLIQFRQSGRFTESEMSKSIAAIKSILKNIISKIRRLSKAIQGIGPNSIIEARIKQIEQALNSETAIETKSGSAEGANLKLKSAPELNNESEPLEIEAWHSSLEEFTNFNDDERGKRFAHGGGGLGFFFVPERQRAFALQYTSLEGQPPNPSKLRKFKISLRNPYVLKETNGQLETLIRKEFPGLTDEQIRLELLAKGYDGITFGDKTNEAFEFVVLDGSRIFDLETNQPLGKAPKLNNESDPEIQQVQDVINQLLNEESTKQASDPEVGVEPPTTDAETNLAKTRKQQVHRFRKTPKSAIRTKVDKRHKDYIEKSVIPNLNALAEVDEATTVLAYELIENFNTSRAAEAARFGDTFTKVKNIKDSNLQKGLLDIGVDSEETMANYLQRKGDDAYVEVQVEKMAGWIDGLAEAYQNGQFDATKEVSSKDAFLEFIKDSPEIQERNEKISEKAQARAEERRKLKIEFGTKQQKELQKLDPETDTYLGPEGLAFAANQDAAIALIEWLKGVNLEALDDKALHNNVLAIDSLVGDGTFLHSSEAFNSTVEMTEAQVAEFGDLEFWDSSPYGNNKGLTRHIASTPQRLAMLSHDRNAVKFLNVIYEPLAIAGRQNDRLGNALSEELQGIMSKHLGRVSNEESIRMGIASYLSQYSAGVNPDEYMAETISNLQETIVRAIQSGDRRAKRYHRAAEPILQEVLDGVGEEPTFDSMQEFLSGWLNDSEQKVIDQSRAVFDRYTNDMRFITEAIRNQPFQEIVNYYRTAQISTNSSIPNTDAQTMAAAMGGQDLIENDSHDASITARPSNVKLRTQFLQEGNMNLIDFVGLTKQSARMTAFEVATSVARRQVNSRLNNEFVQNTVAQTSGDGIPNPERIGALKKWFTDEAMNMLLQASFAGDFHRGLKVWLSNVGRVKLSGFHRVVSEPLSNSMDYVIRHGDNPTRIALWVRAHTVSHQDRFNDLYDEAGIRDRSAMGEQQLEKPIDQASFREQKLKPAMDVIDKVSEYVAFPLHLGDQMAARPRFLADYIWYEMERGAATSFNDAIQTINRGIINEASVVRARQDVDRAINTTIASSKGTLYQSRRKEISLLRDTLLAYSSHGATMGAQTITALRNMNYFARNLDGKAFAREAQDVAAIASQSLGFVLGKAAIAAMFYAAIKAKYRDAEDEDLLKSMRAEREELSAKRKKTEAEKQKLETIDDDLKFLQNTRDQLKQFERSNLSGEGIIKRFITDSAGNLIWPMGLNPAISNKTMAVMVDGSGEKAHSWGNQVAIAELKKAAREAQDEGDYQMEGKIRQQIQDIEGLRYIRMSRESFGTAPIFQGALGIGFEDIERFGSEAVLALDGHREFSIGDANLLLNGLGVGQVDLTRWLNFNSKISEAQFRQKRDDRKRAELKDITGEPEARKKKPSAAEINARARLLLNE